LGLSAAGAMALTAAVFTPAGEAGVQVHWAAASHSRLARTQAAGRQQARLTPRQPSHQQQGGHIVGSLSIEFG
jgi:hypothetical protein